MDRCRCKLCPVLCRLEPEGCFRYLGWSEERWFAPGNDSDGTSVDLFKQGIQLHLAEDQWPFPRFRLDDPLAVQPFGEEDKPATIPDQQFQTVGAVRPENVDRSRERVEVEGSGGMGSNTVNRLCGNRLTAPRGRGGNFRREQSSGCPRSTQVLGQGCARVTWRNRQLDGRMIHGRGVCGRS